MEQSCVESADVIEHGYHYMFSSASLSLKLYEESKERLHLANVYVMTAFALEAYVNELCELSLPQRLWRIVDRRANTVEKITVIEVHWHAQFDYCKPPFQLVKEIFRVRDAFAHARQEKVPALEVRDGVKTVVRPIAPIEVLLDDPSRARRYLTCVYELMGYLDQFNPWRRGRVHPMASAAVSTWIALRLAPLQNNE